MFAKRLPGHQAPVLRIALGFALLTLGCGGGGDNLSTPSSTPPAAPTLTVPASATVGFPVTASAQPGGSSVTFNWEISSPWTFKSGASTAFGAAVSFIPTIPGTVTLTCQAIQGNAIASPVTTQTVTVNPPSSTAGSFLAAGALSTGRYGLAAALIAPNAILVTGGSATAINGAALKSTETYTIVAPPGAPVPTTPGNAMNTVRMGHAVTLLSGSSMLLITGGTGTLGGPVGPVAPSLTSFETYSGGIFTLSPGSLPTGHSGHTATYVPTPAGVLVAGGVDGSGNWANSAEWYSAATGTFTSLGPLSLLPGHSATLLNGGKVLLVGTSSIGNPLALLFDPAAGTFTPTTSQPASARAGHQALLLTTPPGVLILGGANASGPLATAEWYDPGSQTFSTLSAAMASPRQNFGAAILPGGNVLLLGGTADGITASNTAEVFAPAGAGAGSFTPTAAMANPRLGPSVFVSGNNVIVLGGYNDQGAVAAVEAFVVPQ
jgi:hypothetical protein